MSNCILPEKTSFVNFQYYYNYMLSMGKKFYQECNSYVIKTINKEYYSYYETDPSYLFIIDCSEKDIKTQYVGNSKIITYDSIRLNYDIDICENKNNTFNKLIKNPKSKLKYPKTANGVNSSASLTEYCKSLILSYTTIIQQCGEIPICFNIPHIFYATYNIIDVNTNTVVSKTSICCLCKYKNKSGKTRFTIFGTGTPLVKNC